MWRGPWGTLGSTLHSGCGRMEGTAPTRGKFTSFWIFSLYFELFLFEKTWSATLKRLNEVNVYIYTSLQLLTFATSIGVCQHMQGLFTCPTKQLSKKMDVAGSLGKLRSRVRQFKIPSSGSWAIPCT